MTVTKLVRLEDVPDSLDEKLFENLVDVSDGTSDEELQRLAREKFSQLLKEDLSFVWRYNPDDSFSLSRFGILNGIFMHLCPGYRLMITEGPNEPRRIWVCKEEVTSVANFKDPHGESSE